MKDLERYLDSRKGEYSFYFEDIDNSYIYGFHEQVQMPSASCIKVPIAASFLRKVQDRDIDFYERVLVKKEDMVPGSGIIHEFDEKEYTLYELFTAMLIQSDNTATNIIINVLGMDSINNSIKDMGLKNTILARKMMDFKAREKGLENISTCFDLARCLKIIYHGDYLDKQYNDIILNTLKKSQDRSKIPFYIPEREWINIGNKVGSLDGIENDAAILNIDKGNFVFVVMSKSLPNNVYGIVTISRLGKMMWNIIDKNFTVKRQ